jgi:hypothetical protein
VSQNIALLDKSVRRRELREVIGRELKAHCDAAEAIPDHLAELLKRFAQPIDERDNESRESSPDRMRELGTTPDR